MYRILLLLLLTLALVRADELTLRDGTIYKNAKVVSHDERNITILHADGGATIPLASLPAAWQKKYGYDPEKAASGTSVKQASSKAEEWNSYRKALDKYVAIDGKLVQRQLANVTTLNVKLNHAAEAKAISGESLGQGSYVDIYDAAVTDPATATPTGSPVFLKDYLLASDKLTKVDAVKTGATEAGGVYYVVIQPFTFDVWKKAGSPP